MKKEGTCDPAIQRKRSSGELDVEAWWRSRKRDKEPHTIFLLGGGYIKTMWQIARSSISSFLMRQMEKGRWRP